MRDSWLFDATTEELYKGVEEKIKYLERTDNRGLLKEYKEWLLVLEPQSPDALYELNKEDWIFFFGGAR